MGIRQADRYSVLRCIARPWINTLCIARERRQFAIHAYIAFGICGIYHRLAGHVDDRHRLRPDARTIYECEDRRLWI